ncbi:hypothetical protein AOLI_G00237850 [Acnodon oligacanthus]
MAETQRAAVPPGAAAVYTSAAFRSPKSTETDIFRSPDWTGSNKARFIRTDFILSFNRCPLSVWEDCAKVSMTFSSSEEHQAL